MDHKAEVSFVLKIIPFLVCEFFFFHHQTKRVSSQRAKPFCMLFIFAMKSHIKSHTTTDAHLTKIL